MCHGKNTHADAISKGRPQSPPVLIVGAGPTGLTLACELARRGVPFRLIEADIGPQTGSRGKGLQPRTLEVFESVGIVDRVIANGRFAMPMRSIAVDGRVTLSGGADKSAEPFHIPYPNSLITPQWRVEEGLRARLAELRCAVESGTALVGFEQSGDSIAVTTSKKGETETTNVRYLIGCDGGHSIVRKQADIPFEGETREEVRMIVADVEVEGLGRGSWTTWQHAEGYVALCPLPSTDLFQYQAGVAPGQNAELSLTNMQTILEARSGLTSIRLVRSSWTSLWRANARLAAAFRKGNVFLAGDAAHIHSPAGGQGMNTGIQDAYNLGWKLAAVVQGGSPALLDTYQAERRPVAIGVLLMSNARLQQVLDGKGLPTKRDASITQLSIGYRGSVLARDDRDNTASIRAGDRAPDAPGLTTFRGRHRFFDFLRDGRFLLLNFGPRIAASPSLPSSVHLSQLLIVSRPVQADELCDTEGYLTRAYGATDRTLVLLRPDGYIGLISDTGAVLTVSEYFASIL